jgi:hypothetical protein
VSTQYTPHTVHIQELNWVRFGAFKGLLEQKNVVLLHYWGHGKLGRCVIQLSKFLNHTLATHNIAKLKLI